MPSKIESGAKQCTWNKESSQCAITEPPSDPVFIILVSLLTLVLSIPILTVMMYVLDEYGSKEPGIANTQTISVKENRTVAYEIGGDGKDREREKESGKSNLSNSIFKNEDGSVDVPVPCSDFARLIKRDTIAELQLDRLSAAHFAYAGTCVRVRECACA
jgi:hypothetical protein